MLLWVVISLWIIQKEPKLKHCISLLKMESLVPKSYVEKERITLRMIKRDVGESMIVK